jgi:hypothetical protein
MYVSLLWRSPQIGMGMPTGAAAQTCQAELSPDELNTRTCCLQIFVVLQETDFAMSQIWKAKHLAKARHLPLEATAAVVRQQQVHGGDVAPQRRYVQRRLEVRAGLRAAHTA